MTRKGWGLVVAFLLFLCIGSPSVRAESPASLEVIVPDYTVTTTGNVDYVEIPEGEVLVEEEGRPKVPYYIKYIDYPEGYRVQDVILKERSGLVTATGLRLPVVILSQYPESPVEMKDGWYPEEEYDWKLWENPDGSTTLVISLYPFYYNHETTDARFYKNYHFDIEYVISDMEITTLYTDKDTYAPGEQITLDISLNNPGEERDVIVSTLIKQYGSDVTVAGLPLMPLQELAGYASLTAEWDSSGAEEGYYYAEVTLSDTVGNTLNKKTTGILIETSERSPSPILYVIIGAIAIVAMVVLFVVKRLRKRA
jgi:hypothetical protein